jgi:hypothetical protein
VEHGQDPLEISSSEVRAIARGVSLEVGTMYRKSSPSFAIDSKRGSTLAGARRANQSTKESSIARACADDAGHGPRTRPDSIERPFHRNSESVCAMLLDSAEQD